MFGSGKFIDPLKTILVLSTHRLLTLIPGTNCPEQCSLGRNYLWLNFLFLLFSFFFFVSLLDKKQLKWFLKKINFSFFSLLFGPKIYSTGPRQICQLFVSSRLFRFLLTCLKLIFKNVRSKRIFNSARRRDVRIS